MGGRMPIYRNFNHIEERGKTQSGKRIARFFHEMLCESFPANNKIMQPQNFSTANDLHYTVYTGFKIYHEL